MGDDWTDSVEFSLPIPLVSTPGVIGGLTWFGFVIGMADLVTEREAIALARAL